MKDMKDLVCRIGRVMAGLSAFVLMGTLSVSGQESRIKIGSSVLEASRIKISAEVPPGFDYAVVEERSDITITQGGILVSGELNKSGGLVQLSIPEPEGDRFLVLRLVNGGSLPGARYQGESYFSFDPRITLDLISPNQMPLHALNRLGYGPTLSDLGDIEKMGLTAFLNKQLNPDNLANVEFNSLLSAEGNLFEEYQPRLDDVLIPRFSTWAYRKGTSAPPSGWRNLDFDDSSWPRGESGFGYGDNDDNTYFGDMRQTDDNPGYATFIIRKKFAIFDLENLEALILKVDYDDGFVAYINGREVARENILGTNYRAIAADNHEAGEFEEFDITSKKAFLQEGVNVIAIQLHNYRLTSSDASLIPELVSRKSLDVPPVDRIAGIRSLQQLPHVRGVYAPNQLQAVLGEFWENHFTTDYDKVQEFFEDLENSNGTESMSRRQAGSEASQCEFKEYDFFYQNALGRFEDLLLYSATSVPQLIYLDNVTNTKTGPNENYSREILELFAFGVDNRYNQQDIEELSRCFTGWNVRKVWPQDLKPFPESATNPFTEENVKFIEENKIAVGNAWRYIKGTLEPTPGNNGAPTTRWATPEFDDRRWLQGRTGIGYGDNDDRTVLNDMRRNYSSVYLRKTFTLDSPEELKNLVFAINYDDGYVAYINGIEIARSSNMQEVGNPPRHDALALRGHEARGVFETVPVALFADAIKFGGETNVLAIQAHNATLNSSDLTVMPKLVYRTLEEGSIENGDPNGAWAFRFVPEDHDTGSKILFEGTEWEMKIPAGRRGLDGLKDAQDVIRMMANHISTREFICIKLINKFVSDDITLETYHRGQAPEDLVDLLHKCMKAWEDTDGHIQEVMKVIIDPENLNSPFWASQYHRSKVKTPIEYINSSIRALSARLRNTALPEYNDEMGMHLFTRDDPDGWSEFGFDWINTSALLERINFAQRLATNNESDAVWNYLALVRTHNLETAEEIVLFMNEHFFQGTLGQDNIRLLTEYGDSDDLGNRKPLDPSKGDYANRVRSLMGLILSTPHWQYQ